jgi:TRAP-type transport system periplasmic protein
MRCPALAVLTVLWTGAQAAAPSMDLRVLSSWSPNYVGVPKVAERYAEKVTEAAGDTIRFSFTGPASIPAFEQFAPVALGIFDILFTHGIGVALDAVSAPPAALRESGVWAAVDEHYQRLGFKLLALPASPAGYQIYLREPIDESCDLADRRIRGSSMYATLLAGLGAETATLPASKTRAALAGRALDGAAWAAVGGAALGWSEASRYLLRPTFGSFTHLLLINRERFAAMPAADQRLLLAAGADLEDRTYLRFRKYALQEENALKTRGMLTTELCGHALAQAPQLWADGIWALAGERDGTTAQRLRELAREAGISR